MNLSHLGWNHPAQEHIIRITHRYKGAYLGMNAQGECLTVLLSGNFEFSVSHSSDYPAVGDFCVCTPIFEGDHNKPTVLVQQLCQRKSSISRIAAGKTHDEQVLAANVDYAFIVSSPVEEFNINRIHRYVLLAKQGQVTPIVVLSKTDLVDETDTLIEHLKESHPDIVVVKTSSVLKQGLTELEQFLTQGKTGVFIGSSGVGKSSLVNALLKQNTQTVHTVRDDDQKGRHTTTSGSLFFLEHGGMIIDTPGLREIQIFANDQSVDDTFSLVSTLMQQCKFNNCSHENEPGCAVVAALDNGSLDEALLKNYDKLKRESAFSQRKMDKQFASNQKKRWKTINQNYRKQQKLKNKQKT